MLPQPPHKLMPWLQAVAALIIIALFCFIAVGPMLDLAPADDDMKETLKAIMLILTGFLFGSAVGSARKDEQNAALVTQIVANEPTPGNGLADAKPAGTTDDPVAVQEVPKGRD